MLQRIVKPGSNKNKLILLKFLITCIPTTFHKYHSFEQNINSVFHLWILTGKKHPKIKLQCLRKIQIWTFGSLVHQINSFQEVLKLKQIFQRNKAVTGKTPLFVIGQCFSHHSICFNIAF